MSMLLPLTHSQTEKSQQSHSHQNALQTTPSSKKSKPRLHLRRTTYILLPLLLLTILTIPLLYYLLHTPLLPTTLLLPPTLSPTKLSRLCLQSYLRLLYHHPLLTRALSAALIFFIADTVAQRLQSTNKPFSFTRLFRYTLYGMSFMGPFLYIWYESMNYLYPNSDILHSILKSVIEEFSLEPICIIMYFIYDGLVKGNNRNKIWKRIKMEFGGLLIKNAMFWIPANFCNYYLATQELRVVFSNLCSFFWNVYFSSRVNISFGGGRRERGGSFVGGEAGRKRVLVKVREEGGEEHLLPSHSGVMIV